LCYNILVVTDTFANDKQNHFFSIATRISCL
jgi:hypothetical protein